MNVLELLQKALARDDETTNAKAEFVESFVEVCTLVWDELQECKTLLREIRDELRSRRP